MIPRVCDDCECPFLADVGSAETSCLRCFVRTDTSIFFVECEDCDVVIVSPTDEQAASGKDEDGEWHCGKCRVGLAKCEVCKSLVAEHDNVGCCSDGSCGEGVEVMCRSCGDWDDEDEQWRCPTCA